MTTGALLQSWHFDNVTTLQIQEKLLLGRISLLIIRHGKHNWLTIVLTDRWRGKPVEWERLLCPSLRHHGDGGRGPWTLGDGDGDVDSERDQRRQRPPRPHSAHRTRRRAGGRGGSHVHLPRRRLICCQTRGL